MNKYLKIKVQDPIEYGNMTSGKPYKIVSEREDKIPIFKPGDMCFQILAGGKVIYKLPLEDINIQISTETLNAPN